MYRLFFKNTIIVFVVLPNIFVSYFSWGDCKSQEELKTILEQRVLWYFCKRSVALSTNMAAWSRGCKPRIA